MPRQIAKTGDVFWVKIEDDSFILGQIIEIQKEVLNSITCAFFRIRSQEPSESELIIDKPIAIQFVTKDLFTNGTWARVTNKRVLIKESEFPYRKTNIN